MEIYSRISKHISDNLEMVIATIVDTEGGTPGRQAFKIIVFGDGSIEGTVGGGALENEVIKRALICHKESKNHFEGLDLANIGMQCGGQVKVFYEYIPCVRKLYIFGGGHIARAVAPIAKSLGYKIIVIDNRKEVALSSIHPEAKEVICGDYTQIIKNLKIETPAYVLILSHKHLHDEEILRELLLKENDFSYIGMIGSRNKVRKCFEHLLRDGINKEKIERVFSPVGINIGADTPGEIAISILSEIIALQNDKVVPHMKISFD